MQDRDLEHPDITRVMRFGEVDQSEMQFCEECGRQSEVENGLCWICRRILVNRLKVFLSDRSTKELEFLDGIIEGASLVDIKENLK